MSATLSHADAVELCNDSLQLAEQIERRGGPPAHRADDFYRAVHIVEGARDELDAGLGIGPLVLLPWLLLAAGTIVGVATIPAAIESSKRVVSSTERAVSGITQTVDNAFRWGTYAAVAAGAYWLAKKVHRA